MLAGLVARLHSQPDLDLTYQSTCQGITTALAIETGFILGYEENSRSYRLAKVLHDGAWHPVQHYPVFPASIIEAVVPKDGTPLVISGFQAREHLQEQGFSPVNLPAVILLTALNHQGNKNGVLGACANDRERIFSPEEIHFAQDFANRAALAITHSHLFAAIKKQDLFMQLVHKITRITLDNANLEEMLAQVAREVVDTLPIEGCYIGLWEQRKKNLTPRAAAGPNKALFLKRAIAPELAHIIESALNAGRAVSVQDAHHPAEDDKKAEPDSQIKLVLPMKIRSRKIGAILIEYQNPYDDFSEKDRLCWEEIASQIMLAITNILAAEQEKKHHQEAELLQQASITIASSLDHQEVLSQILTSLKKVVPFDSAAICLIEDNHLRIAAQGGSAWHFTEVGDRIEKSAGLFSLLETVHSPVYLADAQQHPNYQHWSDHGKTSIHAWMGVPMIAYDHTIGYLLLNSQDYDVYTPDHARLAQAFVSQAGVAIEKARLFEQVRNGRERLRAVSKKLVEIQEEERRFIAHELHDEIGQELTGMQFLLEMCKVGDEATKMQALAETQELVRGLMSQVRELSINLHPSMLDDLGLLPALKAHFTRFEQKTGIQVKFIHKNLGRRFSPDLEISAFRVVQEALTNTARYAGVKELKVTISAGIATLTLEISDCGQGFNTQILQDGSLSFGIAGMRERTELAGGKFELLSTPGQGTRITAVFPNGNKVERRKSGRTSLAG